MNKWERYPDVFAWIRRTNSMWEEPLYEMMGFFRTIEEIENHKDFDVNTDWIMNPCHYKVEGAN